MKKAVLVALIAAAAFAEDPSPRPPVVFRSSYGSLSESEDARFVSCENIGGAGFYWLDTASADLWRLDPALVEWIYLGSPRGADSGRKGTYQLLSDRHGGVYVLNSSNGEGWWTDGSGWKSIGEPVRRVKKAE
jgi:hypothetical protein